MENIRGLRVYDGMPIKRRDGSVESLRTADIEKKIILKGRVYCNYGGVLVYLTPTEGHRRDIYVTPQTRKAEDALVEDGYELVYIHVPFANGEMPADPLDNEEWLLLWLNAKRQHRLEYEQDCAKYAERMNVLTLPDEILDACMKIPDSGILVKIPDGQVSVLPVLDYTVMTYVTLTFMGTYCTDNGMTRFVYKDGYEYVATSDVVPALEEAGYKPKAFISEL